MSKRVLGLDLGLTSIGYSVLDELENDKYSLVDYGISMFDSPLDKDGKSKKLLHSSHSSQTNLYDLRKQRKTNLAKQFEDFGLGDKKEFLQYESQQWRSKKHGLTPKWELRGKKVFEEKLTVFELFSIFYLISKHRGYKSLDTGDLLEDLCEKLGIKVKSKKTNKDDEKGKIKQALKTIEALKEKSDKTVAQIIYETEIKKDNPTFRNHDNYNYMIRREYINEEIKKIIEFQKKFGLFKDGFDDQSFIKSLIGTIDDQKDSTNDRSLFGKCEYYPEYEIAHQYSLLSDIFKMYQSVSNITFNKDKRKITQNEIKKVADEFFNRLKKGKNIPDIKYKDIRKILNLDDSIKIFNKNDNYINKGKKQEHTITKFHFVDTLSKLDNTFIINALAQENKYQIFQEIFDVLEFEKAPKTIYEKILEVFNKYDLVDDKVRKNQIIIELIKNKNGKSLNISHYAMIKFIPYFENGFTTDEIKQKLDLIRNEDYSKFKKGIKYLDLKTFENDNLEINNHIVKYIVSAVLRLIKHLHSVYGSFDEIRVESTRELSQNEETKRNIDKANRELEKQIAQIVENKEYQKIAEHYGKNLKKYARKILMWQEQEFLDIYGKPINGDIYTGDVIGIEEIFSGVYDIDHIVPQSLGGLTVKHNLVLTHKDNNLQKSNRLPMNFVEDRQEFENRVEHLFKEHKINWKKRKNLLAITLDETFKDQFESKSLRATSYIEALTAQVLKMYYPFSDIKKQKNGSAVRHIQGRATSNIRKLLDVKVKVRDTNIHHAIDAILIGLTNHSWLQKLSNTFRENTGLIDDEARENIKKQIPFIDGIEPKELVDMIEDKYNQYLEESVFYKDIWDNVKCVNYWVSKKPMSSKIHNDSIYAKKQNGFFTTKGTNTITKHFIELQTKVTTKPEEFMEKFKKDILEKMYLYKTNPNDAVCKAVQKRADEIVELLNSFAWLDDTNKEELSNAKEKLDKLIHKAILDNNGKSIRKVQFYQTNLTGFEIRGGLATKEKTFIGFKAWLENDKLNYERIDMSNFEKIKKDNDNSFKVYKNDLVFFIYPDNSFRGGKIVSFLEDNIIASFQNPKYPSAIKFQPDSFCIIGKDKDGNPKKTSSKQHKNGKAVGIIKLNLDILGNIKSYQVIGNVQSELLEFIKKSIGK